MHKNLKRMAVVLCSMCLLTACNRKTDVSTESLVTPEVTQKVVQEETKHVKKESSEPALFATAGYSQNRKLSITNRMRNLLKSSKKEYSIQDKQFKVKNQKGKFDVHYPVFYSDSQDMTLLNSVILAKLADMYTYDGDASEKNSKLNYEVKTATKDFVSIVFNGDVSGLEAGSRIYNLHFTVNFDLKDNSLLNKSAVLTGENDLLEMVHSVIKEQVDKSGFKAFQSRMLDEIEKQIDDFKGEYYVSDGKLFLLVEAVEFGYFEWVGLEI